ncbi:MAG: hypothetical protein QOE65_970 [Solirubrobacteraceae bacterium]|jgi:hypothetical protein|nr:hypothetical protein [Solirubrobacteraceae bacterium]
MTSFRLRIAGAALIALALAAAPAASAAPFQIVAGTDLTTGHDVAVDAAGTGHFTWTAGPFQANVTHYCRVPRGGTGCAPGSERTFQPVNRFNETASAEAGGGPHVLTGAGGAVIVITTRAGEFRRPDGSVGGTSFAFVSADGGQTFSGQQPIGTTASNEAILGPGQSITRIGGPTAGLGGLTGTSVQSTPFGAFASAHADFSASAPTSQAIALDDTGRAVAAWSDGVGKAVRRHSGSGDVNDLATWGAPLTPRADPMALAGGPHGAFVLWFGHAAQGTLWSTQRISASGLAAPRPAAGGQPLTQADLVADASGRLHLVWSEGVRPRLLYRGSPDGTAWSVPTTVSPPTPNGNLRPEVAVAPDGQGFAFWINALANGSALMAAPVPGGTPVTTTPGTTSTVVFFGTRFATVRVPTGCVAPGARLTVTAAGRGLSELRLRVDNRPAGRDTRAPFRLTPLIARTAAPGGHSVRVTLRGATGRAGGRTLPFSVC